MQDNMGPLCGIFEQQAAEQLNHHADRLGFDAISVGGTLACLMDCLDDGLITPAALGASMKCSGNILCDENFFSKYSCLIHDREC